MFSISPSVSKGRSKQDYKLPGSDQILDFPKMYPGCWGVSLLIIQSSTLASDEPGMYQTLCNTTIQSLNLPFLFPDECHQSTFPGRLVHWRVTFSVNTSHHHLPSLNTSSFPARWKESLPAMGWSSDHRRREQRLSTAIGKVLKLRVLTRG